MGKARFEDIYRLLKGLVESGSYAQGTLLPSEHTLTGMFGCSRSTVRRALAELARDGLVLPVQGKGVLVIKKPETTNSSGHPGSAFVTHFGTIVADGMLWRKTGFPVGTELLWVDRVRTVDGAPMVLERHYFRKSAVPGLTPEICRDCVYHYLEQHLGMRITASKRLITVEQATSRDLAWLDLEDRDCLAVITGTIFNSNGVMFEYTQERHHPRYSDAFPYRVTAERLVQSRT